MNRTLILGLLITIFVTACATPGTAPKEKLTKDEVSTMRPEILAHRKCLAKKVIAYSGSGITLDAMMKVARNGCQGKLVPIVAKLKGFGLNRQARGRYLRAIQQTSTTAVTDAVLKAAAKRNRDKRRASSQTML